VTGQRVVVIGGGLAGITAAIGLRDAGAEVTLLESRPRLGGAATSYVRAGLTIDNGQHVFLRCCTSYRELLARLGVADLVTIQDRFDVTVLSPDGPARLRRSALPSPLHLARALAGYRLLSLPERARVAQAALAFRFADPASRTLDGLRLGDWLRARGQGERARRRLWDLFIVSALNIAGDEASVSLAATVIKTALLGRADAADIGIAQVPLGRLHAEAPAGLLGRLGVQIRLGARAAAVDRIPGGGFRVQLTRGDAQVAGHDAANQEAAEDDEAGQVQPAADSQAAGGYERADAVVIAVPAEQAARLATGAGVAQASGWHELGNSPIVNVHVLYDRQVTALPFAAAVDSPVQWVFDKTMQAGVHGGQYLAVSLSAADDYVDMPTADLRQLFLPELARLFPAAARAGISDSFVTRERRATFRQGPGSGSLRPGAATSVPGLALAGAWTDTGWPDTMEGAVRSGHNAAQELIRQLASQASQVSQVSQAKGARPSSAGLAAQPDPQEPGHSRKDAARLDAAGTGAS
jgi:squalene-associated FAD-dependent desaturase